jgi:8-oxo-dGTP pyrophosphatase MutT (NUDIX family)
MISAIPICGLVAHGVAPRKRRVSWEAMSVPPTVPAATLVLFRDGPDGPEHLFVQRAQTMAFAGGAIVFPGGRVDPGDLELADRFAHLDRDDAAARIAAIRETVEEAGLLVGLDGNVTQLRAHLLTGSTLGDLIDRHDLRLDLDALVPFARWSPKLHQTRNFDTRFYLARVDADHAEASVDETENTHLFWARPADVLLRAAAGEVTVIFPTARNLERLALFAAFEDAVAHAAAHPVDPITPFIEFRDDVRHICIPEGLGYPVTAEAMTSATRG